MISWLIISRSSRRFSASTLTICTRHGVRICFCATRKFSLGWSQFIKSVQPESFAEIDPVYFRVRRQVLGSSRVENLSVVNDVGAICHCQSLTNVVIGH